jgi:hypothetical protein
MASRSPRKRRRPRGPYAAAPSAKTHATSLPTTRGAYVDTRAWLLDRHGPVCAYCGVKWKPTDITLDHVTPRKGRTAYDRRDNLVLACKRCNGIKADKPFLAFLLGTKARAINLLRYGDHLSAGILDMCRQLAGDDAYVPPKHPHVLKKPERIVYGDDPDEESPYKEALPGGSPKKVPAARGKRGGARRGGGGTKRGAAGGTRGGGAGKSGAPRKR